MPNWEHAGCVADAEGAYDRRLRRIALATPTANVASIAIHEVGHAAGHLLGHDGAGPVRRALSAGRHGLPPEYIARLGTAAAHKEVLALTVIARDIAVSTYGPELVRYVEQAILRAPDTQRT